VFFGLPCPSFFQLLTDKLIEILLSVSPPFHGHEGGFDKPLSIIWAVGEQAAFRPAVTRDFFYVYEENVLPGQPPKPLFAG
jgi:hypothetical protein